MRRLSWMLVLMRIAGVLVLGVSLVGTEQVPLALHGNAPLPTKRVAIVGAGSAGITTLKTFLVDLPEHLRRGWEVVVFEQRPGVGGVWFPDSEPLPEYPKLPDTPLYPRLVTNTPHPTMTIPNFPFPPGTPLFPVHGVVEKYHRDILEHFNLTAYIHLNTTVVDARYVDGKWDIGVQSNADTIVARQEFDHLVVANGHNHYPYAPHLRGRAEWESAGKARIITHSIFYRHPSDFAGKNVLVIGGAASGQDIAKQVAEFANSTTISVKSSPFRNLPRLPLPTNVVHKPTTSHFSRSAVHFADNTSLTEIDTVIFATGYKLRVPFLTQGDELSELPPNVSQPNKVLSTNMRYIRPLWKHVFALGDERIPPNALAFVGLPIFISNAMCAAAQALLVGHAIAVDDVLPSRKEMLGELEQYEQALRDAGYDPAHVGHRMVPLPGDANNNTGSNYQDELVRVLQNRGYGPDEGCPPPNRNFTEGWRRFGSENGMLLKRAWLRIEEQGEEAVRRWVNGVETEEQWARLMAKLVDWERKWEGDTAKSEDTLLFWN